MRFCPIIVTEYTLGRYTFQRVNCRLFVGFALGTNFQCFRANNEKGGKCNSGTAEVIKLLLHRVLCRRHSVGGALVNRRRRAPPTQKRRRWRGAAWSLLFHIVVYLFQTFFSKELLV